MVAIGAMMRREIPPEDVVASARSIAGRLDELWVVEDVPFAGGISQLTQVLAATEDIVVGHGIAPAPFRNPMALAMEWATLARMYPGRVSFGLGHGVQSWMHAIGEAVASPLTFIEETHEAVVGLLAGRDPEMHGRYHTVEGYRLEFPPAVQPPISLGVTGPKSLRLSGRIADGTILGEGFGPNDMAEVRRHIDAGRGEAGRDDAHRLTVFTAFFVGDPADTPPIPAGAIDGWRAVGSVDEVAAALRSLVAAGIDSLVLVPLGDPARQLDLALDEIVPRL